MQTPEERIIAYRLRAKEVRTTAGTMRHPESAATYLEIARHYDAMADNLDAQLTLKQRRASRKATPITS